MAKTINNCDTCEVSRICGKHDFGGCTKCSFYVEVTHNNVKFGKACLCTFCRSRKGKPEWRQDKTL